MWRTRSLQSSRFQDRLNVGDDRNSCLDFFGGEDYGLVNPEGAEVHFVVRSHGPLIPGMVPEMRSTFAGGCEVNLDAGITASAARRMRRPSVCCPPAA